MMEDQVMVMVIGTGSISVSRDSWRSENENKVDVKWLGSGKGMA